MLYFRRLTPLILTAALSAASGPSAHAQSNTEGWIPIENLSSGSPANNRATRPAQDGWQALEDFDPDAGGASGPASMPPQESDGWQPLDSGFPEGDALTVPQTRPEPWRVIEEDIAAASADINLPNGFLAAGDMIDIQVANVDSITGAYRISDLGTLALPLIGSVQAAGLTADALSRQLEQIYAIDYLVDPKITITPRARVIGAVTLKGLINRSGPVQMTAVESLAAILEKAGGVSGARDDLDAIILRNVDIAIRARRVSLAGISLSELPGPTVLPGDQITILRREKLPEIKDDSGQYPLLDRVLNGGSLRNF